MREATLAQVATIRGRYNLLQVMAVRDARVSPDDVAQCVVAEEGKCWDGNCWETMARLIACVAGKTATSSQGAKDLAKEMLQDISEQVSNPQSKQKYRDLPYGLSLIRTMLENEEVI